MNKLVRFFLVVLGFTSFSVSAVPESLRRMWNNLRGNSVPVNKSRQSTVKNNSLRNASGPVVETTTETNNPYHVAKDALNNQGRSRSSGRPGAFGADDHALQNAIRRDKFTEQEKEAAKWKVSKPTAV